MQIDINGVLETMRKSLPFSQDKVYCRKILDLIIKITYEENRPDEIQKLSARLAEAEGKLNILSLKMGAGEAFGAL
jgi:hypothetical protein